MRTISSSFLPGARVHTGNAHLRPGAASGRQDADVYLVVPGGLRATVAEARDTVALLHKCFSIRLAACWHKALVISLLYTYARPMRPLDLAAISLTVDSLLCSICADTLLRSCGAGERLLPADEEVAGQGHQRAQSRGGFGGPWRFDGRGHRWLRTRRRS